jgi:ribosome-associated heat shock protein Hsp15
MTPEPGDPPPDDVRLDKWLWAARFFRTRALAAQAIDAGRVELNGDRAKRGRAIHAGDRLRIRQGATEHLVTVRALARMRGPAAAAAALYEEDPASIAVRARVAEQHRLAARLAGGEPRGRPTKRDRRALRRLKGD